MENATALKIKIYYIGISKKAMELKDKISRKPHKVLQFTAKWCGPCQSITPLMEELHSEYKDRGVKYFKIDVDEEEELAQQYGIQSIPVIIFFKNDEEMKTVRGADEEQIKAAFQVYADMPIVKAKTASSSKSDQKNQICLPTLKEADYRNKR